MDRAPRLPSHVRRHRLDVARDRGEAGRLAIEVTVRADRHAVRKVDVERGAVCKQCSIQICWESRVRGTASPPRSTFWNVILSAAKGLCAGRPGAIRTKRIG